MAQSMIEPDISIITDWSNWEALLLILDSMSSSEDYQDYPLPEVPEILSFESVWE